MPEQRAELDEAFLDGLSADMAEAKLADAGRVDQLSAIGEVKQACRGGGVRALAGLLGECPTRACRCPAADC